MSLYTGKTRLIWSENRIKNIKWRSIWLENQIKNVKGRSTLSEEAPEYFGAKRRLPLKNENIMCATNTKMHGVLVYSKSDLPGLCQMNLRVRNHLSLVSSMAFISYVRNFNVFWHSTLKCKRGLRKLSTCWIFSFELRFHL